MALRFCACGCGWPALSRRQLAEECWLRGQPVTVRQRCAQARLELVPTELRRSRVPESEWPEGRRWCSGCQSFVLLIDCTGSRCKTCAGIAGHASAIKGRYSLTGDEYMHLFNLQGGRCAICRNKPVTKRLPVDHDHKTDEVRGLLCDKCNHELLGGAHDTLEILRNAVAYLEHPPTSGEWQVPEVRTGAASYGPPPF